MLGHKKKAQTAARRNNHSALREGANNTLDVKSYRGNLYKQTLSPDWSKRRLVEQQQKFSKIDEEARASIDGKFSPLESMCHSKKPSVDVSKRDAFLDTRMTH